MNKDLMSTVLPVSVTTLSRPRRSEWWSRHSSVPEQNRDVRPFNKDEEANTQDSIANDGGNWTTMASPGTRSVERRGKCFRNSASTLAMPARVSGHFSRPLEVAVTLGTGDPAV